MYCSRPVLLTLPPLFIVASFWKTLAESAARLLKDRISHYLYVSSISVYENTDFSQPNVQEDAAVAAWNSSDSPYSRGKAETERRLRQIIGERLTIVRPGPIKGIRDDTPDILNWLRRMQPGTPVLAPGDGSDPVQIVDVRDVADFLLLAIDRSIFGTFNLTGHTLAYRDFLDQCRSAVHSNAELVWIPESFLRQQMPEANLPNWRYFPYWRIGSLRPNFSRISSQKAYDAGWVTRPLRYTAIEYLAWFNTLPIGDPAYGFQDPLTPERQSEIISNWQKAKG
jgi:2'-hydroxyisoflavone reductase